MVRKTRRAAPERASPRSARAAVRGPLGPVAQAALESLRAGLFAIGFAEASVAERLRVPHVVSISLERYPLYRERLSKREALDLAVDLFLLQGTLTAGEASELLDGPALGALLRAGILERTGRGARAGVVSRLSLYPCAGALIFTDHRYRPHAAASRAAPREPVMYLGGDSYALAYLTPRAPVASALDLCTGSGVQAVLLARHAGRVIAVDQEPRAAAFVRLNAALNGVADRVEVRLGDLFDPIEEGRRFDLIVANPPFVPTPHRGRTRIAFRDAGPRGEDVLARLLAGLPGRLERDGTAALVSVFADGTSEPFAVKLERWLPRGAGIGALLVRLGADDPAEYAFSQTRRPFGSDLDEQERRFERWLDSLKRARLTQLNGGVLALRAHAGPTPPFFRAIDAPWPPRPDEGLLDRAFRACDATAGIVFSDELFDRMARVPEDIVFTDEIERLPRRPAEERGEGSEAAGSEEGPRTVALRPRRHRVRAPSVLGGELGVSFELRAVLERCDGTRSLRAVVEELAGLERTRASELGERLYADLIELASRGFILIEH